MVDTFESFLVAHQDDIYTSLFFLTIATVAIWEGLAPRRTLNASMAQRWKGNFGCLILNGLLLWVIYSGWGISTAIVASEYQWGLLRLVELPFWGAFVLGFILMDLGHYTIHYSLHRIPLLWRMHRLHHSDPDFDFTTGSRFHPGEAVLEHGANLAVIALVGPPLLAVMLFVFSYVMTTCWVHGNICMPANWDRRLRWIFITPEMHRTHHSQLPQETNSNYGGLFSFWDRLFGNYVDQPAAGHEGMRIGLQEFEDTRHIKFGWMLLNPFLKPVAERTFDSEAEIAKSNQASIDSIKQKKTGLK